MTRGRRQNRVALQNRACLAQRGDLVPAIADLQHHLFGMLAKLGRGPRLMHDLAIDAHR